MREMPQRKLLIAIIAVLLFWGITITIVHFISYPLPEAQSEDYQQISTGEYDSVFLSMYPIDTCQEETFLIYGGTTVFKASYCIPEFSVFNHYMKQIMNSENVIHTVYLGICPDKTDPKKLQSLINLYPSIHFEIMLSYPSAEYWKNLSVKEYNKILKAYCNFLTAVPSISNANFYFMGSQEWLISNPGNYIDEWQVNESIAQMITLLTFMDGEYSVTMETASLFSQTLTELTEHIRFTPKIYPDLSNYRLVFFGDSVIGNYTDSASIPGAAAGLTGATVFNCGLGGSSATMPAKSSIALPTIVEAFTQGDPSILAKDSQVYQGVSSYLSSSPSDQKLCFIIYYGLNDYFCGYPISSDEDPYDTATFCGAIRTAVTTIHSRFPDAGIILCTPNYVPYFQEGTELHGAGYVLEDYVNAVLSLADELQTDILDTYHDFGVNYDNWDEYILRDLVHPAASFRYLIGEKIIRLIH